MNISYIYFDLDDTLLDHHNAEEAALEDVYDNFGFAKKISLNTLKQNYSSINKKLWKQYSNGLIDRSILQRNRIEKTLEVLDLEPEKWRETAGYYKNAYKKHWQWIEGKRDIFEYIAEQYPTGLLTNGFAEVQKLKYEQFRFNEYVSNFIISEEVGVMKPQSGIFEYATQKAEAEPAQILYIGDSLHSDVRGGSNYGWNVVWYNRLNESRQSNQAVFSYTEPEELKKWISQIAG